MTVVKDTIIECLVHRALEDILHCYFGNTAVRYTLFAEMVQCDKFKNTFDIVSIYETNIRDLPEYMGGNEEQAEVISNILNFDIGIVYYKNKILFKVHIE